MRRRWLWPLLAVAAAVLVAGLAPRAGLLPVWIDPVEEEMRGAARWAGGAGPVALLLPDGDPVVDDFPGGDWTWGWINFLQQEVGPYSLRRPDQGDAGAAAIVVIPRALARAHGPERFGAARLQVVECPGPAWADALGATGPRQPPRLLAVASDRLAAPLRATLAPCPAASTRGQVLASDDAGRPLIWRRAQGEVTRIGLGFDLSLSLLAMQQGIPADDLRVVNRFEDRHGPLIQTSDLVGAEALLDTPDPAADRLERLLGLLMDETTPRPRLWYHAGAADGSFVMTHDDEAFGDRSRWMTEHEARLGVRSTTLFQPGRHLSRDGLAAILADGSEPGLHWNRLERAGADYESVRRLGVEWARRRTSLAEQTRWLRSLLPEGVPLEASRTHFLAWGPDYGSAFRALAAAGYRVDSSYGVDFGERGYLFGTGRPFQAIDTNGLPLPIWEVPHLMAEDLAADRDWLDRLLARSQAAEHQVVTVLFHPIDMEWRPSVALYRLWKESYGLAAARGHRIATLSEVAGFWRRRISSRVAVEPVDGGFQVQVEADGPGHAVALPALWEGRPLRVPGRETRLTREGARPTLLVPVPAGRSTFEARPAPR